MDIHNYQRQFEEILKENKKIILEFKDYLLSEGISIIRINRYFYELVKYDKILKKPYPQATKSNIRTSVAEIEQTNLSPESKKCFKVMLRKLYRYLEGVEEKGTYPEIVNWIQIAIPKHKEKFPEELLKTIKKLNSGQVMPVLMWMYKEK